MTEPEAQQAPRTATPAAKPGGIREKIKQSTRPELEALAGKLFENLKLSKDQTAKTQKEKTDLELKLAERDALVESLKKRESDLLLAASSTTIHERTDDGSVSDVDHSIRLEEVEKARMIAEKERKRREEDLEAARIMCDELRSQLEDARMEVTTLKEAKASVDVASLELADYAKKVAQLTKDLKETKTALELADKAKEDLAEELRRMRDESGRAMAEGERAKESVDEMRKKAQEEAARLAELQLMVDEEKRRTEIARDELTKDRVALGRQLGSCQERSNRLEEIVEALREENGRLRSEREAADTRVDELQKDYDAFKNRARYVLDQRTKEAEEESNREREEKEERAVKEKEQAMMIEEMNLIRESQRRAEADLARANEQINRLSTEKTQTRKEADEATAALATSLDELRSLRLETERAIEEASALRIQASDADGAAAASRTRVQQLVRELDDVREKADEEKRRLEKELNEEKRRREEANRQLEERRDRAAKTAATPVAAVYPQFSESFTSDRSLSPEGLPFPHHGRPSHHFPYGGGPESVMGGAGVVERQLSPEKALESVMFGEEACDEGRPIDEYVPPEDLVEEVARLRQQLEWMKEMHTESETAAANMDEQMRVLKEEIRRMQRNSERISHVEGNTEYLKNVIVKFISPEKVAGERAQLIPILHTMLRLSDDELALLQRIAANPGPEDPSSGAVSAVSSWGSMIPRWTGLS